MIKDKPMNYKMILTVAGMFLLQMLVTGCDEDNTQMGVYDEQDGIENAYKLFTVKTCSAPIASVPYTSTYSYLGNITDPETDAEISACFAAQFHTFEDYAFPAKELLTAAMGTAEPEVDSVEVRLYFDNYYGDKNNPMKLEVYPLRADKLMQEDVDYYIDTDLEQYADMTNGPIASKVFTPRDYIFSDAQVSSSNYDKNVRIVLDKKIGNEMLKKYYNDPSCYKDSYNFIRRVFPGLYFRITNGSGTMLKIKVGTLNLYFRYLNQKTGQKEDAVCRFAATPEVIQSTHMENGDLSAIMAEDTCTLLKTPAGICTEMELPVNEIFKGHENDSISKAQVTLTRYNNKVNNNYSLDIPGNLLMVRKQNQTSFFSNKEVYNDQTSFATPFTSAYNTYTFPNIGRLVTYCYREKMSGMAATGMTEAEWEAAHPDWNKVMIMPVTVTTTTDAYGNVIPTVVTHELGLTSTRLVGGPNPRYPIQMEVVYSSFK